MASDTTGLKIAVEEGSSWNRRMSITVPADRVQRMRGRVAEQIARGARLPGFRKGKLPTRVIEQRFGPSIDQETVDQAIQEAYREALEAEGITPISQARVERIEYDRGSELTFEVEFEIQPEIELSRLSGFTVSRPAIDVGDAEVESVLDRLRDERATWVEIDEGTRPDYGDQALVEITALGDGDRPDEEPRTYRIVIGEQQAIPDVENAILTLARGETGEFNVRFPDDFPDEARRGEEQRLNIELKEANRKVLPELDDAFAAAVGEFENVAALRDRILEDLRADAEERTEAEVRRALMDQILEANGFDAPESMLHRYLDYMIGLPDDEERKPLSPEEDEKLAELRQTLRPQAEWGLKRTLVVERIAEQEGLRATQDDIDERVEKLAEKHDRSPSDVWIQLEKSGQLESLEREITEEKVYGFLKAQNTVA
jgi:trigger factor